MIQALIFDFDGTVLDTEVPDYQSWVEIYEEHGCQLPLSTWSAYIGGDGLSFNAYAHLETLHGQPVERDAIRIRRRKRYAELVASQSLLPGVMDYILTAQRLRLKLAIASSGTRDWVTGHLKRFGLLRYFDCIKCADDVQKVKPDPALYLAALANLRVTPEQAIALEDSPNGILAAKRAGLFCVAVPNQLTGQLSLDQADIQLSSLASLPLEDLLSQCTGQIYLE